MAEDAAASSRAKGRTARTSRHRTAARGLPREVNAVLTEKGNLTEREEASATGRQGHTALRMARPVTESAVPMGTGSRRSAVRGDLTETGSRPTATTDRTESAGSSVRQTERTATASAVPSGTGNRRSAATGLPESIAASARTGNRHTAREGSLLSTGTGSLGSRRRLREESRDSAASRERREARSVLHLSRCSAPRTRAESGR